MKIQQNSFENVKIHKSSFPIDVFSLLKHVSMRNRKIHVNNSQNTIKKIISKFTAKGWEIHFKIHSKGLGNSSEIHFKIHHKGLGNSFQFSTKNFRKFTRKIHPSNHPGTFEKHPTISRIQLKSNSDNPQNTRLSPGPPWTHCGAALGPH